MTGSVDNIFTHIQGGQCGCYSCMAAQLADVIADRAVIMDESIEQAGRIAALEAALRVGINVVNGEYSAPHCDDWIRTTRNLLVPNAGLTSETSVNECGCRTKDVK